MKKVLLLPVVMVLALAVSTASEKVPTFFEFNFVVPILSESYTERGFDYDNTLTSVGAGISTRTMYSRVVGVYASMDIFVTQQMKMKASGYGQSLSYTFDKDDWDLLAGFDFLMGPAIVPVNTERFSLVISPGIDMTFLIQKMPEQSSVFSILFGLGANVMAEFHITSHFNISAGIGMAYDFLGYSDSVFAAARDLKFAPRFGIGFNY